MLDANEIDRLNRLAVTLAAELANTSSSTSEMQIRFDVYTALQHVLEGAGIPPARLTPDWTPKPDFNDGGWRRRLERFTDVLHQRNPAYGVFATTSLHAASTYDLTRLKIEDYLVKRIKAALARAANR